MKVPDQVAQQVKAALAELQRVDPEGWPETLVSITAGSCALDVGSLNLLADAATQAAAEAHQLEMERIEEDDTDEEKVRRN